MSKHDNGGPAFPLQVKGRAIGTVEGIPGMTLHDWYAGRVSPTIAQLVCRDAHSPLELNEALQAAPRIASDYATWAIAEKRRREAAPGGSAQMSLATWMTEYCPVAVADVPKGGELLRDLLKWTGLLKENLERHGLKVDTSEKVAIAEIDNEDNRLVIDASTCSLCEAYRDESAEDCGCDRPCHCCDDDCDRYSACPLHKVRGVPCDRPARDELSPYIAFSIHADPQPMIDLIRKAIAAEEGAK